MQDILTNLNLISEKLFKSVESEVYTALDDITIISEELLKKEPLKNILFETEINFMQIIANSFIIFFVIHYITLRLISLYNGNKAPNFYTFILRITIVFIISNNSYFVCETILKLFSLFTNTICSFTDELYGKTINFSELKETIINLKEFASSELLSLNGLIKGIISFGAISILINFAVRYITIILLIIISPICIACLASDLTLGIFESWIKMLISNLSVQILVKLIIFIPLMFKNTSNIMYKICLVGSIYLLYKLNNLTRELLQKIVKELPKRNIFNE